MTRFFCLFFVLLFALQAYAEDTRDYSAWSQIPILHDGRVKPLHTFAKHLLTEIHGSDTLPEMNADRWLALVLFYPEEAVNQPIFRISDVELRGLLKLPDRAQPFYAFSEFSESLDGLSETIQQLAGKPPATLTATQRELIELYQYSANFWELLRSLTLVLPLKDIPDINGEQATYLTLFKIRQKIEAEKQQDEKLAALAGLLHTVETDGQNSAIFRVIPPQWNMVANTWLSPWATLLGGAGSPATSAFMHTWQQLAYAYRTGEDEQWQKLTQQLLIQSHAMADGQAPSWRINIEMAYYQLHPFTIAVALYLLTLLALRFKNISAYSFAAGWCFHTLGLVMRILILMRPPVSNLYESILFVSWAAASLSAVLTFRQKMNLTLASALAGAALLLSFGFAPKGDTLGVVIAVLNTDFWLATHVICITLGYSLCLVTAGFAHLWLWRAKQGMDVNALFKQVHTLVLFSLFFTATGTILGGIWADQSWGRFWGWDPKENGALLIVLWLTWTLHGKLSGRFGQRGFMASIAALSIVVAFSWLGVNLLGVGLHSYGFTDRAAWGLGGFCAMEILAIAYLALRQRKAKHA